MKKNSNSRQILVGFAAILIMVGVSSAGVYVWDGGGTDNNWTTPENWSTNVAPPNDGTSDIRLPYNLVDDAKYTITVNSSRVVNSLLFQNAGTSNSTYSLSGSSLTIDGTANGGAIVAQKPLTTETLNLNVDFSMSTVQTLFYATDLSTLQFGGQVTATNSDALNIATQYNGTCEVLSTGSINLTNLNVIGTNTTGGAYSVVLKLNHNASLLDTMALSLTDSAHSTAKVNLNFSGEETIGELILNGTPLTSGLTYGGTGSGADVIDATHFTGTGLLYVVPEPATLGLVTVVGFAVMTCRHRLRRR